uniref:Serine aminopeptidase S33 domain-containing protein n=1 Tax=Spongospora subterranea TaxID=70186 RepID=A0A0H5R4R9_9EUKA|eukprot:CRZ09143.1 hypothetical protein [Spongospora subterranea]
MKLGLVWGSIAGAAAGAVAAIAALVPVYGNQKSNAPMANIEPCNKRFCQYLQNPQGHWLYTKQWSVPNPVAILFISHGLGDHILRYEHVARYFNLHNFSVFGVDHQGHGQSHGTEMYVERFDDIIDDYLMFIEKTMASLPTAIAGLPKFLLGHSMGGAIAIHTAMRSQKGFFDGVVLSSPMLKADPATATPMKIYIAKLLSKYLPKLPVGSLSLSLLTVCDDVKYQAKSDKLYIKKALPARVGSELIREMEFLQDHADEVVFPYHIFYGTHDKITAPEGMQAWSNNTQSEDKSMTGFPGLMHEIMNEQSAQDVLHAMLTWIMGKMPLKEIGGN